MFNNKLYTDVIAIYCTEDHDKCIFGYQGQICLKAKLGRYAVLLLHRTMFTSAYHKLCAEMQG